MRKKKRQCWLQISCIFYKQTLEFNISFSMKSLIILGSVASIMSLVWLFFSRGHS
jgi:hypothetical protein